MDLQQIADDVSKTTSINVTKTDIERLVSILRKKTNPWEIVDYCDFPIPAVFESINLLKQQDIVQISDKGIDLTNEGRESASELHPVEDLSCKICEGRGIDLKKFAPVREKFIKLQRKRPKPSHDYDQGYVTPHSTFSRFLAGYERGDVYGKDILVIGDDDLLSIVLGLSGMPKSITVLEIDERLTKFIADIAEQEKFEVSIEAFDMRKPLPKKYIKSFDTFYTDPPETLKAADAFIGKGISTLRQAGSAGYFGFTRREASLKKWYDLQKLLTGYKVVITDIMHNFSEYVNWGYEKDTRAWELSPLKIKPKKNWYRSAFYRIVALKGYRGSSKNYGSQNIYEDLESSTT
ncbi:MAG: bis-aminopropyl spermidine synthase family protein [Candidatus Dadabacteria bacterium]|nr:bis-aminopropyl spermidine synthase family protein [Candidatus Dadabacteria bacterium]NIS09856.1 bis-aminopropyl spermidine synthase family protein [Candidatus Dadabacteria bacterium]NIY22900.1 bis-aminopropyl spermidine synthase family protein [Candidatus Dadabacteria bacterium]